MAAVAPALVDAVIHCKFDENSGETVASDTGSGVGLIGGPYDGTYIGTPNQVNDGTEGDVIEHDVNTTDSLDFGSIEGTTGIPRITFALKFKSTSASNVNNVLFQNNIGGSNDGDFTGLINTAGTNLLYLIQTSTGEFRSIQENEC